MVYRSLNGNSDTTLVGPIEDLLDPIFYFGFYGTRIEEDLGVGPGLLDDWWDEQEKVWYEPSFESMDGFSFTAGDVISYISQNHTVANLSPTGHTPFDPAAASQPISDLTDYNIHHRAFFHYHVFGYYEGLHPNLLSLATRTASPSEDFVKLYRDDPATFFSSQIDAASFPWSTAFNESDDITSAVELADWASTLYLDPSTTPTPLKTYRDKWVQRINNNLSAIRVSDSDYGDRAASAGINLLSFWAYKENEPSFTYSDTNKFSLASAYHFYYYGFVEAIFRESDLADAPDLTSIPEEVNPESAFLEPEDEFELPAGYLAFLIESIEQDAATTVQNVQGDAGVVIGEEPGVTVNFGDNVAVAEFDTGVRVENGSRLWAPLLTVTSCFGTGLLVSDNSRAETPGLISFNNDTGVLVEANSSFRSPKTDPDYQPTQVSREFYVFNSYGNRRFGLLVKDSATAYLEDPNIGGSFGCGVACLNNAYLDCASRKGDRGNIQGTVKANVFLKSSYFRSIDIDCQEAFVNFLAVQNAGIELYKADIHEAFEANFYLTDQSKIFAYEPDSLSPRNPPEGENDNLKSYISNTRYDVGVEDESDFDAGDIASTENLDFLCRRNLYLEGSSCNVEGFNIAGALTVAVHLRGASHGYFHKASVYGFRRHGVLSTQSSVELIFSGLKSGFTPIDKQQGSSDPWKPKNLFFRAGSQLKAEDLSVKAIHIAKHRILAFAGNGSSFDVRRAVFSHPDFSTEGTKPTKGILLSSASALKLADSEVSHALNPLMAMDGSTVITTGNTFLTDNTDNGAAGTPPPGKGVQLVRSSFARFLKEETPADEPSPRPNRFWAWNAIVVQSNSFADVRDAADLRPKVIKDNGEEDVRIGNYAIFASTRSLVFVFKDNDGDRSSREGPWVPDHGTIGTEHINAALDSVTRDLSMITDPSQTKEKETYIA